MAEEAVQPAPEQATSVTEASIEMTPGLLLTRQAALHLLLVLVALGLYAAADSWYMLTGLGLALMLSIVTALLVGISVSTLIHEWFHLLGARLSGGAYHIPAKAGLFVYDWHFAENNVRQFYKMSVAGSVGGAVAVLLLWYALPIVSPGRAAVLAGAVASFVFAAVIEWPVVSRTRSSGDPLAELSKITPRVLLRALIAGTAAGALILLAGPPG